jgi:type IV pilus assembly protein PilM
MNLLPKASGSRPRVACEIAPEGVTAARASSAEAPLEAVSRAPLASGAVLPGLKPGNLADRVAVIAAIRRSLEGIDIRPGRGAARPNSRGADLTLILPDGAVRVLLLDFDALPGKLSEALPIVRFRLKKLVPFEADDAMISFQVMSSTRNNVRVLAVAIPRDILTEYETAVREAGFDPGAVLPSTLAALAGITAPEPTLVVNASHAGITTAITQAGLLLLHRSVDLQPQTACVDLTRDALLPPDALVPGSEPAPVDRSPYLDPTLPANLNAELHNAVLVAPTSLGTLTDPNAPQHVPELVRAALHLDPVSAPSPAGPSALDDEIAQAVSVAVAWFEDTLSAPPAAIFSAGALGAEHLRRLLHQNGFTAADDMRIRELVDTASFAAAAVSGNTPRGALAGVAGALRG